MRNIRRTFTVAAALAGFVIGAGAGVAQAQVGSGTIKVDAIDFDADHDNQPHDACDFEIDYYGYPAGSYDAVVVFTAVAPSGSGVLTATSGDQTPAFSASGAGGALNGGNAYQLDLTGLDGTDGGYHIDVDVVVASESGAIVTLKQKTFWLRGCPPVEPSESVSPSPSESVSPSPSESASVEPSESASIEPSESVSIEPSQSDDPSISPSDRIEIGGPQSFTRSPRATVLGVKINRPGSLPRTGLPLTALLGAALLMVGAGGLLARTGRLQRGRHVA